MVCLWPVGNMKQTAMWEQLNCTSLRMHLRTLAVDHPYMIRVRLAVDHPYLIRVRFAVDHPYLIRVRLAVYCFKTCSIGSRSYAIA